jgi:hypothetical protein
MVGLVVTASACAPTGGRSPVDTRLRPLWQPQTHSKGRPSNDLDRPVRARALRRTRIRHGALAPPSAALGLIPPGGAVIPVAFPSRNSNRTPAASMARRRASAFARIRLRCPASNARSVLNPMPALSANSCCDRYVAGPQLGAANEKLLEDWINKNFVAT